MARIFKRNTALIIAGGIILFGLYSCEKLLEQKPPTDGQNILPDKAIETADDLQEVLTSAYDVLANTYNGGGQNLATLMSDNVERPFNQLDYTAVWLRNVSIFNGTVGDVFRNYYIAALRANTVIENADNVSGLSESKRTQIIAEARFIRALVHFDAVRGWARAYGYTDDNSHPGVAIRTGTQIVNAPRSSVSEVYSQVLSDLSFAKSNLPEVNDIFATKWAAIALEAEVRFQRHEYQNAYDLANRIITEGPFMMDTEINKYQHPQAGPEAIFYIFSVIRPDGTNVDNRNGVFRDNYFNNGNPTLRIPVELFTLMRQYGPSGTTPRGDLVDSLDQDGNLSFVTNMFNAQNFNIPVLSYTQMLLIRAESSAELGISLNQALQDVNAIRERAYGSNVGNLDGSASADEIVEAARLERRLEFPFNGQRYYDLVRIGAQGEDVEVRDAPWDCPGAILQFPSTERTDLFPLNPQGGCN